MIMRRIVVCVVTAALVGGGWTPASAQADRAKLAAAFADVDRLFTDFATQQHVPGAAWGIVVDGQPAHLGTTGFRDLPTKSPVTADTVFRIASMTKSFTAMAILKLRDEGKLALDDPAERYVPEMKALKYPTSDSPKITVRHLLSHSEGFPEDNPWGDRQLADTEEQLSELIKGGIPFSNTPGVAYEYSNFGFAILGRIVSNVSGVKYPDYVSANILKPLGMTSTTLEPSTVPANRLAHGYRWEDEQWKNEPLLANGSFGPMGGMLTSVSDLSRYVGAFLSAWPPRDGPETAPIRRASLREMQQVWRPTPSTVARNAAGAIQLTSGGYAYGLRVSQSCAFRQIVTHTRRTARVRLDHALAARIWSRDRRVRQRDVHRLDARDDDGNRITGQDRRAAAATAGAVTGVDRRAPQGVAADRALGRRPCRQHCRGQPLSRSVKRSAARGDRAPARNRRRVHAGVGLRLRRKRPARALDDELRKRKARGRDYARADDAAESSTARRPCGAGDIAEHSGMSEWG
jgi:CubicO group peptidase (beta-lactamase class C family)